MLERDKCQAFAIHVDIASIPHTLCQTRIRIFIRGSSCAIAAVIIVEHCYGSIGTGCILQHSVAGGCGARNSVDVGYESE